MSKKANQEHLFLDRRKW